MAKKASEAGKIVVLEKPAVMNMEEFQEICPLQIVQIDYGKIL